MLRLLPSLVLAACAVGIASCGGGGGAGTPPVTSPTSTPSPGATSTPTPTPASPTPSPTPNGPTPTPSPAPNTQPIVVANAGGNDVLIFAPAASGNVAPQSTIAGSNTTLSAPSGLAVQSGGTVYTSNAGSNQVLFFNGTGNVAPSQAITDTNAGVASYGLALSTASGFALYLSSQATGEVDVYTNSSANGPTAPNATISGGATTLAHPTSMAVDRSGNLYVLDGASIKIFANAVAGGNIAPTVISGGATTLNAPAGIGLDGSGNIMVTDGASVKIFAAGSTGNVAPSTVISGAATGLQNATGVSVDGTGAMWVCDAGANAILRFKKGASGNIAPITVISGSNTTLNNPVALQLQPVI